VTRLIFGVGATLHLKLFFRAALGFTQPLRAGRRDRPGLLRALSLEVALSVGQKLRPAITGRQVRGQLIAAPLTEALVFLTPRGGVRIRLRGDQTAAMFVKLAQVGGKRVGGTERGSYNCTAPGTFTNSQRLSDYGRKVVRRHGRLAVKLTFRIINGLGVTNKRVLSGVIKSE